MQQVSSPIFTDDKVSDAVLDLVRQAQNELFLVSPYNSFWDHLRDQLQLAIGRGVQITAIYRTDDEKSKKDMEWLGLKGATVYAVDKLHAKIYQNESTVIVTSMNLWNRLPKILKNWRSGLMMRMARRRSGVIYSNSKILGIWNIRSHRVSSKLTQARRRQSSSP